MKPQSRKKVAKAKKKEDKKNAPPTLQKMQPPPPEWKPTMDSLRCLPCIQHLGLVVSGGVASDKNKNNDTNNSNNNNNSTNSMIGKIPTAILEHLLEERNVQSIVRKILADEKEKASAKNKDSTRTTFTFATSATIRELKERSESETLATTRAISKHYRRASVQVHPDRYGETYRAEFDALQKAHQILSDPDTRRDYLDSLLGVVQRMQDLPRHLQQQQTLLLSVQQAHVSWLQGYEAKQNTQHSDRARYYQAAAAAAASQQQQFRLEGGLTSQQPRRMRVNILRDLRSVRLGCPFLRPAHVYSENVVSVSIMAADDNHHGSSDSGHSHDKKKEHRLLYTLSGSALTTALEEAKLSETETLTCVVKLPDWGIWNLFWHASVRNDENGGQVAQTCSSATQEVDMTHPQILKAHHDLPILLNQAKRHAGLVKALGGISSQQHAHVIPSTNGGGGSSTMSVEQTYWHMHQTMTKARSTALRLQECLEVLYIGDKGDTKKQDPETLASTERSERYHVLQNLTARLDDATAYKATLEERLAVLSQRDSLKQFKRLVGNLLESGEATEWMSRVTPDQLCDMMSTNSNTKNPKVVDEESANTAVNRLYQLLVEGKKATSSLALDANILTRASKRDDLFSGKQCETLQQRAVIKEKDQAAEREELEEEARRAQQAEATHQLLQKRAMAMPCARGDWVSLHSLQKRPDLNGKCGKFMGIDIASATERYCIRLYTSSNNSSADGADFRDVSLLAKNFAPWDQLQARNLQQQHEQAQQHERQRVHSSVHDDDDDDEPTMSLLFPINQGSIESEGSNLDINRPPQEPLLPMATREKSPTTVCKSWMCSKCTFLHEGKLAAMTECDLCGTPREVTTAASSVSSSPLPLSGSMGNPSPTMNSTAPNTRSAFTNINATVTAPARPHPPAVATITSATTTLWSPAPVRPQAPIARPTQKAATGQSQKVSIPIGTAVTTTRVTTLHTQQHHHLVNGNKVTSSAPTVSTHSLVAPTPRHATPALSTTAQNPAAGSGTARSTPCEYPLSKIRPMSNRICKATAYIRNMDVALFIGQKGKHIKLVQSKTGISKLVADQKSCIDTEGGVVLCPIRIEGNNVDCVQKAVTIVEEFAKRQIPPYHNAHLSSTSSTSSASPTSHGSPGPRLPNLAVPVENVAPRNAPQTITTTTMITPPQTTTISHVLKAPQHCVTTVASPSVPAATVPQHSMDAAVVAFNSSKVVQRPTITIEGLLRKEMGCFKCTPQAFSVWLQSMDVWSLGDLAEAMGDDEFINEMQANGLKGFKRNAFKKAVEATHQAASPEAVAQPHKKPQRPQGFQVVQAPLHQQQPLGPDLRPTSRPTNSTANGIHEIPNELLCPISHNLLVNDPVVARDGYTYEREHIEAWFAKKGGIAGFVRSPMADMILDDLTLVPNASIKSMARSFARTNPHAL